ncbi:hypothetical protein Tco_0897957 [Tanacetum coccineum]
MNISDIQKNLYNTLIESYNSDKDLFASYGDVVTLKRGCDDQDKDEEPSARSNQGTKRRRLGKEELSKEATQKESKSTSSSKETLHQEFNTGNDDISPTVEDLPPQSWMTQLAQASGTQSSFHEFLTTTIDFSAFIMNRLKLNNLTQDALTDPTYDLMKGTCKSVVELEYYLEEVFKATNDQLDWHNPEGRLFYGYATNMETPKNVYSRHMIIDVTSLKIMEFFGYKHLEEITVRRLRFLNFFNEPRIIREQRIAAYKGYRGGVIRLGHMGDDVESLGAVLERLWCKVEVDGGGFGSCGVRG